MASKRKSTTPCMIPSKLIRPVESIMQDPPVLLRQPRISGDDTHSAAHSGESSKADLADVDKDGAGSYSCKLCNFETHDLNLFLDHVYSGHPEFRAEPSFVCMNCAVSAPKFEGLALHNARVHPSTLTTTLQLRRRDRRTVVEQTLTSVAEMGRDEISITKTPIMRMLKGKAEAKRIIVSHPVSEELSSNSVSASRGGEAKEATAVTVTHVPTIVHNGTTKVTLPSAIQIVNGSTALPILKPPVTPVASVAQSKGISHSTPINTSSKVSSSTSHLSSKNLPKVMIPLSSIPTYSASMDESSFLKTTFSKFPYPTKAELCYLTVVTKYPEEQIKIWFTAQRLKQGISWSPEEIEEARRKMFNTIIQTAPASTQSQGHSGAVATPTITVLPASLGATGIPQFLQGSLVSQGGVIVTQPMVANGIQVSSAPVALAVTPKPQAAARPMMQARPAAALVADKGISMVVGTVGSSRAASSGGSSSGASEATCDGGSNSTGNNSKGSNIGGSNVTGSSSAGTNEKSSDGGGSDIITSSKSEDSSNCDSSQTGVINLSLGSSSTKVSCKEEKIASTTEDSSDQVQPQSTSLVSTKKTDVSKDPKNTKEEKTVKTSSGSEGGNSSPLAESDEPKEADVSHRSNTPKPDDTSLPSTEPASVRTGETLSPTSKSPSPPAALSSGSLPSRSSLSAFLDPIFCKGKKSQEQLNTLKDSFLLNQFPDQEEVDRLISLTGLTVREVRKWFSDRRYHFRNLKGGRSSTGGQGKGSTPAGGSTTAMDLSESGGSSDVKTLLHGSPNAPFNSPTSHSTTSPSTPSRRLPRAPSPDFTAIRYKEREPHQVKALEASFGKNAELSGEEVDRLRSETKMTRREIHGWFTDKKKRLAAEKKKEDAERALKEGDQEAEADDDEDKLKDEGSGEPKVNPIKINLKMLKVTEASGKVEGDGSEGVIMMPQPGALPIPTPASSITLPTNSKAPQSSTPTAKLSPSPKLATVRGKKSLEQLHLLKQVYARTQWPSATQYDELISGTGLPRSEVVRWFGDCRYVQKNGQLKWLEEYQTVALEEDLLQEKVHVLRDHLDAHHRLDESQLPQLAEESGLTADLVRHWFSCRTALPTSKPTAAQTTGLTSAGVAAKSGSPSTQQQRAPTSSTDGKTRHVPSSFTTNTEKTNICESLNISKGMD